MYVVEMIDDEGLVFTTGIASTEGKAKQMIEILKDFDPYKEYKYSEIFVDMLFINDKEIVIG